MREVHGVVAGVKDNSTADQQVRITDYDNSIGLFHTHKNPALLDVDEAFFLARQLALAARRLKERQK